MEEALVHADGRFVFQGRTYRCALGRGGVRADKEEGDGATPLAVLPLRRVYFRADRVKIPVCAVPDGWCDDPTSRIYNQPVRLPCSARHEELWRRDALYDIIAVLGWNDAPVERRRGSAIFLHVARADYAATEGCVALALPDLREVLAAGIRTLRVVA
ncbi:MAG: L,D-transpeptidase family protein [Alphaproteobacteria bacterium]|nr:L,D-transpeptidase family protein [Alphaproteobacteria bacterium]